MGWHIRCLDLAQISDLVQVLPAPLNECTLWQIPRSSPLPSLENLRKQACVTHTVTLGTALSPLQGAEPTDTPALLAARTPGSGAGTGATTARYRLADEAPGPLPTSQGRSLLLGNASITSPTPHLPLAETWPEDVLTREAGRQGACRARQWPQPNGGLITPPASPLPCTTTLEPSFIRGQGCGQNEDGEQGSSYVASSPVASGQSPVHSGLWLLCPHQATALSTFQYSSLVRPRGGLPFCPRVLLFLRRLGGVRACLGCKANSRPRKLNLMIPKEVLVTPPARGCARLASQEPPCLVCVCTLGLPGGAWAKTSTQQPCPRPIF